MSRQQFDFVLRNVEPTISKDATSFREPISAEERLMVTLRYLATGSSMTQLNYDWCLLVALISEIIPETSRAIYTTLRGEFLTTPTTVDEWLRISEALETRWNYPNALGKLFAK